MNEYCDRCGAAGLSRFVKDTRELVFCGHHTREYGPDLDKAGFEENIIDESISTLVTA